MPILPTLVVALACATMMWLGVWQLQRARWKEGLLARYAAAEHLPALPRWPGAQAGTETLGFRHVALTCAIGPGGVQIGGRNRAGVTGYRRIAPCAILGSPDRLMLDVGWSRPGAAAPEPGGRTWRGMGRLIPDPELAERLAKAAGRARGAAILPLLLVADAPLPGYEPSVPPAIADIPNNHRAYAVQWFLFAAVAFTVYLLALRRRRG